MDLTGPHAVRAGQIRRAVALRRPVGIANRPDALPRAEGLTVNDHLQIAVGASCEHACGNGVVVAAEEHAEYPVHDVDRRPALVPLQIPSHQRIVDVELHRKRRADRVLLRRVVGQAALIVDDWRDSLGETGQRHGRSDADRGQSPDSSR